jgi:hypothetical protein
VWLRMLRAWLRLGFVRAKARWDLLRSPSSWPEVGGMGVIALGRLIKG